MKKRVFVVLFVAVLATMIGLSIIEPLMSIYAESLGASGLYIGLIFAAFTISRGIFTPLAGKLSDHHGRKNFILGGLAVYVIASFLYLTATSINSLIIVRFLQGAATAFVAPIAMAYIGDIAPKGQEGKYLGTFTISMFLGFGIGPLIGGTLNHVYGMNTAFIVMGVLGIVALFMVLFMLPELGSYKKNKPTPFFTILKDRVMQEIMLLRIITSFGVAGFIVFLPLYAVGLGLNTAQIGMMVTVNLLVTALPQRYFGKLADKHNKTTMMIIGNIIMAGTILLIPLTWNFYSLLVVNAVMGLGGAVAIPANTALAAQFGKIHGMGSVMGLLNAGFAIGMTIGPLIAGVIHDFIGINMVFIYTSAIVTLGTAVFYGFVKRNNQKVEVITT